MTNAEVKIVDKQEVLTKKEQFALWKKNQGWRMLIFWGFFICFAIFLRQVFLFLLGFGSVLFSLLFAYLDWSYAWVLTEKQLQVTKYNWFKSKQTIYPLTEIERVTWSSGGKVLWFKFFLKHNRKFIILPPNTIYESASLLRSLHQLGIPVSTTYRDAEIEMFIEGKIDKIPMELTSIKKD